jgi:GNAT superfamily N-acetyltransferase
VNEYAVNDPDTLHRLADTLGDTPQTTIPSHLLRRELADAYLLGNPDAPDALIVHPAGDPGEPQGFGHSAAAIWRVLQTVEGWFCLNVAPELADPTAALMTRDRGWTVKQYGDIYYRLDQPVTLYQAEPVRLMTAADLPLLEAADEDVRAVGFGGPRALLEHGYCAGAILEAQVVAIAQTYARTARHSDIGVSTLAPYRGRGYASTAAALVAQQVQADGQSPVWSTGEDNAASKRLAAKLGFRETGRRIYLIPQTERA